MADAKIITYGEAISATVDVVPDNNVSALAIESTDASEFVRIDSSSEYIILGDDGAKVGINDAIPQYRLTVKAQNTNTDVFGVLGTNDATAFRVEQYNSSGAATWYGSGGASQHLISARPDALGFVVFNELGEETDFRVESANNTHMLFVDGSADTVSLGRGVVKYFQGTGADTATTQAVYLADTNATLIIDFANGNVGDVTLAAGVTAVKFFNVPADGTAATVTARITQDSSTRTIDYSDSAVTCYSDGGSSAVTGEIKFSGGVHHTQSTGSGEVDIISFTSIPTGSTFNIYAAVIGQGFA